MQYRATEKVTGVDASLGTRSIEAAELQAFTARVFEGLGMPVEDAATEAEVLVWANLRGIDSHGVQRVAAYSRAVDHGNMNPRPRIRVERETAATVLMEADHAFGPVVTVQAMERVMAKAQAVGIGWGLIRNTSHQGAMAYYAQMAAAADLVGLAVVCSPPNMAPPGAKQAGTHNSPIAVAVPGAQPVPRSAWTWPPASPPAASWTWRWTRVWRFPRSGRWMRRAGRPPTRPRRPCCVPPPATRATAWRSSSSACRA